MDPIAPLQTRQTLRLLGFVENEIRILSVLFVQKKMTTKEISKLTALSFDATHNATNMLEKRGLIRRTSERGEDMIEICTDEQFLRWIDEQKQKNAIVYDDAKDAIRNHFSAITESSWKPNVLYFEGSQGIKDVYDDMIATGKEIRGWTDIQKIHATIGDYMDTFIQQRIKKGITSYAIMPKNPMNMEYAKKDEKRFCHFSDNLPIDGEIRMYGDKVAVITFHREKPVGFVFSGAIVSSIFRGIFEHAWNN